MFAWLLLRLVSRLNIEAVEMLFLTTSPGTCSSQDTMFQRRLLEAGLPGTRLVYGLTSVFLPPVAVGCGGCRVSSMRRLNLP
jgi:hypothetical protein